VASRNLPDRAATPPSKGGEYGSGHRLPLQGGSKSMNRRIVIELLCLVLGAALSLCAQDLTITNARIIAANGSVIERGSIVVRSGSIVAVASGSPGAAVGTVIDARGMTAMPGFIDAHRHINTGPNEKEQMQALLEAGYTTILSG